MPTMRIADTTTGNRVTDEPPRKRDLLAMVDVIRIAMGQRTAEGELSAAGVKVATAALEVLEAQLNRL